MSELDTTATDPAEVLISTGNADVDALFARGFEKAAAEEIVATAEVAPSVVAASLTTIDPAILRKRVALFKLLIDNTGSMSRAAKLGGKLMQLIALALSGHDHLIKYVLEATKNDPVDVLFSADWLNARGGRDATIYPFSKAADVPLLSGTEVDLHGWTPWMDRFSEIVTALVAQVTELEKHRKQVTGLAGILTDGFDNKSDQENRGLNSLRKILRGLKRSKVALSFVIYCGDMPKPGDMNYESERGNALNVADGLGIMDAELEEGTLEEIVRAIFVSCGIAPGLVFLPGEDPQALVEAIISISQAMVSVSQGQIESLAEDMPS